MNSKLLAQIRVPGLPDGLGGATNPSVDSGLTSAGKFISSISNVLIIVAAIAAFIYLILGGLEWITSGGDKTGLESARNKITHAIVGLIVVAAAWAVWILVGKFLGINVNALPFPTLNS